MLKIIFTLTLFFSGFCLGASSSSDSSVEINDSDQVKILYQRAEQYIENDNFKKSLIVLKALIKREDLSGFRADIYNLLGFSYRKLQKPDLDKSFAAYMMALEIDPEHVGVHEYLGELYLMMNNKNKAIEMLVKLESLTSSSSNEYLDLKEAIDKY
tara:strand:- start:146 stop:613 length:468 start_codon:yes stop_codon:yes gene_type:complete